MEPSSEAQAASFDRFVLRTFEWELGGYTFFELKESGAARQLGAGFSRAEDGTLVPQWWLLELEVDSAVVNAFAALLDTSRFRDLEAKYEGDVIDGTTQDLLLQESGGTKRVHCSNRFPEAVETLRAFIRDEILANQKAAAARAPRLTHDEAEPLWEAVLELESVAR